MDDLIGWLNARGGIAHSSAVREHGFAKATVAAAVAGAAVVRIRRSWLATRTCDPARVRAARLGGRLTCVSEARDRGLWTPARESQDLHVAVPSTASRLDAAGFRIHWGATPVPLTRTEPREHPINMLFHVARCLTLRDAAMTWESALRKGIVQAEVLARIAWGSTAASLLASMCGALSDSGLETRFVWIMRAAGVAVRQQIWIDGHPVDALIGDRLVVQIDGFAHHRAADRRRDLAADARLVLRGYTVLRFDYWQILFAPDEVRESILVAIAQGLHRAS